MKKKTMRRAIALGSVAVLSAASLAMFTGCTTDNPEITITFTFQGKDYGVDYKLSRKSAPQTVQHFIELADNGYYEGLCIHDYDSAHLYTGAYTYADGELSEKNYFETVKDWNLTQSVFLSEDKSTGLNTVYGEFGDNGVEVTGSKYSMTQGALVMFYTDKGTDNTRVWTQRSGSGELQYNSEYKYNSATSQFFTFTGSGSGYSGQTEYCVFGMATNYSEQMDGDNGLLTAISKYVEELAEGQEFTSEYTERNVNRYDPIDSVRNANLPKTFNLPVEPIVVKSVKVNKY